MQVKECQVTYGISVSIDKLGHIHFSIAYIFSYNISDFSHMYTYGILSKRLLEVIILPYSPHIQHWFKLDPWRFYSSCPGAEVIESQLLAEWRNSCDLMQVEA